MKKKLTFIGISSGNKKYPHPIHKAWIDQYSNNYINYTPYLFNSTYINHILSLFSGIFIKKYDVYLLSGLGALPKIVFKKLIYGKKIKVISINSDTFFFDLENSKNFKKKYYFFLLKYVDLIINTSSIMEDYSKKHFKKETKIVHPFVDIVKFKSGVYNVKSNNLCSISAASYSKGIDLNINFYIKFWKNKFPKSKYFILGKGPKSKYLKKYNFVINPNWADPSKYFKNTRIYLNLSRLEPFGVNIIEAMAYGIPCIISKNCGAKDYLNLVDKNLIISSENDLFKIANKIINNKKYSLKISKKSKKIAKFCSKKKSLNKFKLIIDNFLKDF